MTTQRERQFFELSATITGADSSSKPPGARRSCARREQKEGPHRQPLMLASAVLARPLGAVHHERSAARGDGSAIEQGRGLGCDPHRGEDLPRPLDRDRAGHQGRRWGGRPVIIGKSRCCRACESQGTGYDENRKTLAPVPSPFPPSWWSRLKSSKSRSRSDRRS